MTAEKKLEVKPDVKKPEAKPKEESKEAAPPPIPPPAAPPPVIPQESTTVNNGEAAVPEEHYYNTNGHIGVDAPSFSFPPPNFSVPPPTAEYGYGGWHPPFWNNPGASWLPHQQQQPIPDLVNITNSNHEEAELSDGEAKTEEKDSAPLDLDTRIELLLKGNMAATAALNTPAFLQLQLEGSSYSGGSSRCSSRGAEDKAVDPCASPPLSIPPSPFLSLEIYLEHHRAAHPEVQGE